jgi:hypothetical protein
MSGCTHKTPHDFHEGWCDETGHRLWRCSVCEGVGIWDDGFEYFGSMECRKCWVADIDAVFCGPGCRDQWEER